MQPLFHAVQHGVKAGRAQEAYDEVFWRRIVRGIRSYMIRVLRFGAVMSTLARFFETPWRTPVRGLDRQLNRGCSVPQRSPDALGRLTRSSRTAT